MVFGVTSQSDCNMMAAHHSTYRDLVCCSTDGCNLHPNPPTNKTSATPRACQVIGVQVSTAMQAIGGSGNCDSKGTCYNMTDLHMKDYIGTPRMVPLEPHHFSCIDGRHDDEIVATPAGDMGIFLSSVFIYLNRTANRTDFSYPRMRVSCKAVEEAPAADWHIFSRLQSSIAGAQQSSARPSQVVRLPVLSFLLHSHDASAKVHAHMSDTYAVHRVALSPYVCPPLSLGPPQGLHPHLPVQDQPLLLPH
jgi:hypothetical protein